jgi:hypothetical protein
MKGSSAKKNFMCQHLRDGSVPTDDTTADSCLFIAMLNDLFSEDMPNQYTFRLVYTTNTQHVTNLPPIHENWKMLAQSHRDDMAAYRAELSDGFSGYRVFATSSHWSVVVIDTMYAVHVCDNCLSMYKHEINSMRCKDSSNHMSYPAEDLARFWYSLSHDLRSECVRKASFLLVLYIDDQTTVPEYRKLVSVVRGDVSCSGSTLIRCLDIVTEGTCYLRTRVERSILSEPVLRNGGYVALMAHELCVALVDAYTESVANSLMEEPVVVTSKPKKVKKKSRERFMKRLDHMVFGSDMLTCSSWADLTADVC